MKSFFLLTGLLFVTACLLAGCGAGGVAVDGKVVNGDKPYSPSTDGDVNISMTDEKGQTCTAKPEADGTFKVKAQDGGSGIPPGKYKVKVTIYPPAGSVDASKGPPTPANKSLPESWEVSGPKTFTLDLSKLQ